MWPCCACHAALPEAFQLAGENRSEVEENGLLLPPSECVGARFDSSRRSFRIQGWKGGRLIICTYASSLLNDSHSRKLVYLSSTYLSVSSFEDHDVNCDCCVIAFSIYKAPRDQSGVLDCKALAERGSDVRCRATSSARHAYPGN